MNAASVADLHAWLASDQDFAPGVALYARGRPSPLYQHLFALGETDYARQVLHRELRALLTAFEAEVAAWGRTLPPAAPPAPAPVPVEPAPTAPAAPAAEVAPPADAELLADLQAERKAALDERSHLHPQLTAPGMSQARRFKLCGRIVQLTDRDVELQLLLAHVRQHGRLPGPLPLDQVTDAGELRRRLTNLRCQRSKLRKDPARAADLARVEADIDLISNKLTSPANG